MTAGSVPSIGVTEPAATRSIRAIGTRPWLMLVTLTFVYVLNFLDRQLIGILAKPIQDSLQVSDGQLGLIGGLYFAMFYCFIAIPVGWLADRTNRVNVLSLACAIWSGATIACGMAATYPQLVVARMLVGFGEAGGVPPSYAIITDTYPPGKRAAALGIFNLGPAIGAAIGVAFGAAIAERFGWRMPFIIIGVIGLVTALLVRLFLREPERGATDQVRAEGGQEKAEFWPTVRMFFSHPVLMLAALGSGATQFVTYGLGNFAVLFLMRDKGMVLSEVAVWYALVLIIGMGGGMVISGRVIDRMTRTSRAGYAIAPALSLAVAMPFYLAFIWAPTWPLALALLAVVMMFNYFYLSASVALVQDEVRPNQRVLAGALLLLVMNFIGLGLGPTYVGMASDFFRPTYGGHALQAAYYALAPMYLIAAALFMILARLIGRNERLARGMK